MKLVILRQLLCDTLKTRVWFLRVSKGWTTSTREIYLFVLDQVTYNSLLATSRDRLSIDYGLHTHSATDGRVTSMHSLGSVWVFFLEDRLESGLTVGCHSTRFFSNNKIKEFKNHHIKYIVHDWLCLSMT